MKILIAASSAAKRMIIGRTLRQAGFGNHDFIEAQNGSDGMQKVVSQQPGLILSDWNMPVVSGLEFLRMLRADGNKTKFGFVCTDTGSPERQATALEEGALFLLQGRLTPASFKAALTSHVS